LKKHNDTQKAYYHGMRTIVNDEIKDDLEKILREPIRIFFQHSTTAMLLYQCPNLPFLFIIDEASWLYQASYMHCFMWVLDIPVVDILRDIRYLTPLADQFFVLMLGTHSQITQFSPNEVLPSERYFRIGGQHLPSVFSSLSWDANVEMGGSIPFEEIGHIKELCQWGRSMWMAIYNASNKDQRENLMRCVEYATRKIFTPVDPAWSPAKGNEMQDMNIFAVLAIRLHLDLDFCFPSRASRLVCSKMRWLVDIDSRRKHIRTTYGSEPLLVEAAAKLRTLLSFVMEGIRSEQSSHS
jgi:hypothetical protein